MALAFNAGDPARSSERSRTAVLMRALGIALVGLALVAFAKLSWVQLATYVSSRDWPVTQATVTSLEFREEPANFAAGPERRRTLVVSYVYEVDGQSYEGTRASLSDTGEFDDRRLKALYARLNFARLTGRTVPVFYQPDEPGRALVDRTLGWPAIIIHLAAAFTLLVAGLRVLRSAVSGSGTRIA